MATNHPTDGTRNNSIDLYGVLRLERTATTLEIQKAYKALSRHFHPDKRRGVDQQERAQATFVLIKQAHDVLVDRVLRFAYDHGGMVAVEMVKRSQARRRNEEEEEGETDPDENEPDDEENFYEAIQKAKSKAVALKIVRRLVRAYEQHQQSTQRTPLETNLTIQQCYHRYAPHPPYLASESSILRIESSQPVTLWSSPQSQHSQMDVSLNCTAQVQRTSAAALSAQVGCGYRPDGATQVHAMMGSSTAMNAVPQLTLQTTRRLWDKSLLTVGAGGTFAGRATWACTIASSRVLLLGSLLGKRSTADDVKLHASWRCGLALANGQLQSLVAQVRTTHFPQWKLRLGLGGPLVKVTYNHAAENSFHCTATAHWGRWKAKVTKEDALDDTWSLRYGLKYDTRSVLLLGQPWSVLLHFHSDDWTLHLPIDLIYGSEWPLSTILSSLLLQILDEVWDNYSTNRKLGGTATGTGTADSDRTSAFRDIIHSVAERKRQQESDTKGLVFLSATWNGFAQAAPEDVTDLLQYWTVDGSLRLATARSRWSSPWVYAQSETLPEWWKRCQDFVKLWYARWKAVPLREDSLYVRYQYSGTVYEVEIQGYAEELVFPHTRATAMGDASRVW